jgi:hypothetical protein
MLPNELTFWVFLRCLIVNFLNKENKQRKKRVAEKGKSREKSILDRKVVLDLRCYLTMTF